MPTEQPNMVIKSINLTNTNSLLKKQPDNIVAECRKFIEILNNLTGEQKIRLPLILTCENEKDNEALYQSIKDIFKYGKRNDDFLTCHVYIYTTSDISRRPAIHNQIVTKYGNSIVNKTIAIQSYKKSADISVLLNNKNKLITEIVAEVIIAVSKDNFNKSPQDLADLFDSKNKSVFKQPSNNFDVNFKEIDIPIKFNEQTVDFCKNYLEAKQSSSKPPQPLVFPPKIFNSDEDLLKKIKYLLNEQGIKSKHNEIAFIISDKGFNNRLLAIRNTYRASKKYGTQTHEMIGVIASKSQELEQPYSSFIANAIINKNIEYTNDSDTNREQITTDSEEDNNNSENITSKKRKESPAAQIISNNNPSKYIRSFLNLNETDSEEDGALYNDVVIPPIKTLVRLSAIIGSEPGKTLTDNDVLQSVESTELRQFRIDNC